jgi:hypothetical protein
VNNLTPYEILIAQKTEQVAVPDMSDSIWASIEQQLDAGPSPDDGNSGPSKTPPVKGLPGAGNLLTIFTIATIAIALTWFFTREKKETPEKIQQPSIFPATEISPPATDSNKLIDLTPKKIIPLQPIIAGKDTLLPSDNYSMPFIDTLNKATIPSPIRTDSVFVSGDNKPPVVADTSSVMPPSKKPKGVKGISDNDYKIISTKKDSTKKGG